MKTKSHAFIMSKAFALLVAISISTISFGNEPTKPNAASKEQPSYGPYTALSMNTEIVKGVKVAENGRIYLLLNPIYKEKKIVLKNSMSYKSGYRKWFNGQEELISPANQGKASNEFTDWVETTANYIEYYMGGELILHLGKRSVIKH